MYNDNKRNNNKNSMIIQEPNHRKVSFPFLRLKLELKVCVSRMVFH